jgi:hypothetical protein
MENIEQNGNNDPAADFLAREEAELAKIENEGEFEATTNYAKDDDIESLQKEDNFEGEFEKEVKF